MKKSVNQNETQGIWIEKILFELIIDNLDRPLISSRLATTSRPESNVSFSLR
jgi:hypothetical protein